MSKLQGDSGEVYQEREVITGSVCMICLEVVIPDTSMSRHRRDLHSDIYKYQCEPPCEYSAAYKHHLLRHRKGKYCYHNCPVVCANCDKRFVDIRTMEEHQNRRRCLKLFRCPFCDITFSSKKEQNMHVYQHNNQ